MTYMGFIPLQKGYIRQWKGADDLSGWVYGTLEGLYGKREGCF